MADDVLQVLPSRNDVLGFALRTRKNLDFVLEASKRDEDVHTVTQLANSLLGLLVFLHEGPLDKQIRRMQMSHLESKGWPTWEFRAGSSKSLGDHLRHLRNAIAHRGIKFSTESRELKDVLFVMADQDNWHVAISGDRLHHFCLKLCALVEETLD